MRMTVVALGTRGDVQPMIALAKGLHAAGHTVQMIAGSNFAPWITRHGLDFLPSVDMEALMNSPKGLVWTESSNNPRQQLRMMRELIDEYGAAMAAPILACTGSTDLLISGFVSEPFVQSACEHAGLPHIHAALQPQQPTRSGSAGTNPLLPRGNSIFNWWIGQFAERLVWSIGANTVNMLRTQQLGLPAHTPRSYLAAKHATPIVYGFSRHVVPRPADWPASISISGYWFLEEGQAWQPPADLQAFLAAGPPPVYIGFGSMSHRDPQATLRLIVDALQPSRRRAVLAAGWSGVRGEQLPDHLFALESAPHDWLLPRMAGIVHHGGAGTTAAGLRAGKPTLIIPHMSDQPYWGRRVYELGVGPKPIPRHKLTADALARGIDALVGDTAQAQRAARLGQAICAEDGVAAAVATIERLAAY